PGRVRRVGAEPAISSDGAYLVFGTVVPDLFPGEFSESIVRCNLQSRSNEMVSVRFDGTAAGADLSSAPVVSSDGHLVAFHSATSVLVCANCDSPSLSGDGRLVAYQTANSTSSTRDIVVKDLQTGATDLISRNRLGIGGGNGNSTSPLLSWDGRFVVLASKAS